MVSMSEAARPTKCLHLPDALMRASKPETLTAEEAQHDHSSID